MEALHQEVLHHLLSISRISFSSRIPLFFSPPTSLVLVGFERRSEKEEAAQACRAGPVESAWVKRCWRDTLYWEKPSGEWTLSEPSHVVDEAVLVDDEPEQCVDEYVFVGIWAPTLHREMAGLSQEGAPQNIDWVDDDFLREACKTT